MHRSALHRKTKVSFTILLTVALVWNTLAWIPLSVSALEPTEQDLQSQEGGVITQDIEGDGSDINIEGDGSGTGPEVQTPELFSDGSQSPDTTKETERTEITVPHSPKPNIPFLKYTLFDIMYEYKNETVFKSPGDYDLIITGNQESDDSRTHETIEIQSGYDVLLKGQTGNETLTSKANILFTVKDGGTLTISNLTLDAGGRMTLIKVEAGGKLILEEGAVLTNCASSAICNKGTLIMNGGSITGNDMQQNNYRPGNGGVFNDVGATFTMKGGSISENGRIPSNKGASTNGIYSTKGYAGGVTNLGTFTMSGGEIQGNGCYSNAGVKGAGGVNNLGTFTLEGKGIIAENSATIAGDVGGVYNSKDATFTLAETAEIRENNDEINGKVVRLSGGGVYNDGTFNMNGGTIQGHKVKQFGGGVYNSVDGTFTMKGGLITENVAMGESTTALNSSTGGGVFNSGTFNMHDGVISHNIAAKGGGIQSGIDVAFTGGQTKATFTMDGGVIAHNTATANGGGLFVYTRSVATITAGRIEYNEAQGVNKGGYSGGGIYINQSEGDEKQNGTLYLRNAVITDNESAQEGSGIAACPYSNVQIYMLDGGAIYGNQSSTVAPQPQVYVAEPENKDREHVIELSKYMLGGGEYHWTDAQGKALTDDQLQNGRTLSAYNTIEERSPEVQAAKAKAQVWITNNTSAERGGGIGCNGNLYLGTASVHIRPADIIIYMGGLDGNDSAVNQDNQIVHDTTNTLPVPGFVVEVPRELREKDLEDPNLFYLEYDPDPEDGTSTNITWKFEKYGPGEHNIYRIVPKDENQQTTNVIMKFTDGEGNTVTTDQFGVAELGRLNQFLSMEVSGENIDKGLVNAVYGEEKYSITTGEAKIDVRNATSTAMYGFVQDGVPADGKPGITAPNNTIYTINTSPVQVKDASSVALLFDDIVENNDYNRNNTELLKQRTDGVLQALGDACVLPGGERHYQMKYLDLIDRKNGDAWLTSSQPLTIYWPLPEGTTKDTKFELLHFCDLHRDMEVGIVGDDILNKNLKIERLTEGITVTDTHVEFVVQPRKEDAAGNVTGGFSPFALVWEEPDNSNPEKPGTNPQPNPGTDDSKPQEPAPSSQPNQVAAQPQALNGNGNVPQTGDSSKLLLWVALCAASLTGLVAIGIKMYRHRREK